jgi:NADH:ubiquinone oxidoreductase subunit 4 (subunit M)
MILSLAFVILFTVLTICFTYIEHRKHPKPKKYLITVTVIEGLAIIGSVIALLFYIKGL